jgi:hypothetical protein
MTASGARTIHRALLRAALSAGHVFAWIFVFQYFYIRYGSLAVGISSTLLTFALSQTVTVLLTPWCAQRLRFGFKRMLVYATLFLAAAFAVLAAAFSGSLGTMALGVACFALLIGGYRALYFTPYAVAESRETGKTTYLWELLVAFAPGAAGLLLMEPTSAVLLLGLVSALLVAAMLPLYRIPDIREGYSWGYLQTFHELFAPQRARMLFESLMEGAEGAALLILWPLLVFVLLGWSYLTLGLALSCTFVLAFLLRALFERSISRMNPGLSALINASAWLMRLGVGGPIGVVLVDTYFYIGSQPRRRGFDMHAFEQMADNTTYIDEHTALKEIGLALGRLLVCVLTAALLAFLSIPLTFLVVFTLIAIAAASSVYLSQ